MIRRRDRFAAVILATVILAGALGSCATGSATAGSGGSGNGGSGRPSSTAGNAIVPSSPSPTPQLPVTVTSADGRDVTITDVSRIVPLWGSISEVVFSLGLGTNVVGRDLATTFAQAAHLPVVTHSHDVSAESVLSLRPTLVLAQTDSGPPEALDQIRNAGIPVFVLDAPIDVDGIGPRVRLIARALGVPAAGDDVVARTDAELAKVQQRIPKGAKPPKVAFLYMRGQAGVYLIGGKGSGADSMIAAAGGSDAGTAMGLEKSFTPITSEALAKAAPDVILMTTTGLESVGGIDGLVQIPGIAQTPAGQSKRVVAVEDGLLYSFGARTPVALQTLIDSLHHEVVVGVGGRRDGANR